MYVAHDQSDGSFGTALFANLAFKAQNAKLSPTGREVRRSYLSNGVRTHLIIIAVGAR